MFRVRTSVGAVCLSVVFGVAGAGADSVILNPEDTHVSRLQLNSDSTNFGNETTMLVAGGGTASALMQFDLAAIPAGATITGATLELYVVDQLNQGYFKLYRITNAWSESEATYNERLDGTDWDQRGGDFDEAVRYGDVQVLAGDVGGYKTFSNASLLSLVQSWYSGGVDNYGLGLRQELGLDNRRVTVGSSESGNAPRLTITYEPIPEPASVALVSTAALLIFRRRG